MVSVTLLKAAGLQEEEWVSHVPLALVLAWLAFVHLAGPSDMFDLINEAHNRRLELDLYRWIDKPHISLLE